MDTLFLEVTGGADHGARMPVDCTDRTIGRARDCDLVLRDLAVSRRHAKVRLVDGAARITIYAGAAPAVTMGRVSAAIEAKTGEHILLGNTTLVVRCEDGANGPRSVRADVRTLHCGVGIDALHLAAIHSLVELLDGAEGIAELEAAARLWAAGQTTASNVELVFGDGAASAVTESLAPDGTTRLSVPAPCNESAALVFSCAPPPGESGDSLRSTLVIAGRLFGSALTRVQRLRVLEDEKASLRAMSFGSARAFLGSSHAAERLARLIPRLGSSDVNVLLDGETGSGKTFVARLIHEHGPRAKAPMRVINCAAIPESLIESELFGHERGAFTGAVVQRAGAFEAAGRGTLLLDEIGELALPSQAKLLRVLEERRFERIGSNRSIPLEARIISATNRDLEAMVAEGRFRSDLFFRIAVIRACVLPLRERGDDLPLLAQQILSDLATSAGRRIEGFSPAALEAIARYSWPGNVRELRNAIEHAVVLGDGPRIEACDFPPGISREPLDSPDPSTVKLPANLAWLERRSIEAALRETNGNRTRAAAILGVNRQTIYNKLAEFEKG